MKHVTPVLLARWLASADPERRALIHRYDVQSAKRSKKETGEAAESSTKISFKPARVTCIDVEESVATDLRMERQKRGPPYDPDERVECEILSVVLQRAFPNQDFNAPRTKQRKNTEKTHGDGSNSKSSNTTFQNKDQNKRKISELHSSDHLEGLVEEEAKDGRPPKRPRGRSKEVEAARKDSASGNEVALQSSDADQALRDLSPDSDLPDLDGFLQSDSVLFSVSPNASRKSSVLRTQMGAKGKILSPAAFIEIAPKFGRSNIAVDLIDLTSD
ncbi:MAG: hypothetical protein Q9165_001421 [Trypethelium subeluteriae]